MTTVLTVLAIYAVVEAAKLHLPIPTFPNVLAVILPIFSFLVLTYDKYSTSRGFVFSFIPESAGITILALLDSSLATAACSLIQEDLLKCSIDSRWQSLYTAKDTLAIKGIQEAFNCCGLHSNVDRAWPFPVKGRGADSCSKSYGRTESCEGPWKQQERIVLGIWLAIGLVGLITKVL